MEKVLNSISQVLPDGAPEWVHLVPAGTFVGLDGRGPFTVANAAALIAASMVEGRKLPIDENHSIDLQSASGGSTPARGWIVAMEARPDGIWGKVEWTAAGRELVEGRAYGFISPVFNATKAKPHALSQILRAALTNSPNLVSLKSLHSTSGADPLEEELKKLFGLADPATVDDVLKVVRLAHTAQTGLATIAAAAGAPSAKTIEDIVTAINAKGAGAPDESATVKALEQQVTSLNTQLASVVTAHAQEKAVAVVDQAIKDGKIVPALRDRYISRHVKDAADVEEEIKLLPSLHGQSLSRFKPGETAKGSLSAEDEQVCEMMGLDREKFAETNKLMTVGA